LYYHATRTLSVPAATVHTVYWLIALSCVQCRLCDIHVNCCREKSKKWSEQMSALVCLRALGADVTAGYTANRHMSQSSSSSSSSSSATAAAALSSVSLCGVYTPATLSTQCESNECCSCCHSVSAGDVTAELQCDSDAATPLSDVTTTSLRPAVHCSGSTDCRCCPLTNKRLKLTLPTHTSTTNHTTDE